MFSGVKLSMGSFILLYTCQSASYRKSVPSRPNTYSSGQHSILSPSFHQITFAKNGRNPPDPEGNTTRCMIYDSVNHWANDCPDRCLSNHISPTMSILRRLFVAIHRPAVLVWRSCQVVAFLKQCRPKRWLPILVKGLIRIYNATTANIMK